MSTNYDFLSTEGVLLLSPIKQRIRDSFAEATESKEGFREFQFFCKSLCGKHFYGTKKSQSVNWLIGATD